MVVSGSNLRSYCNDKMVQLSLQPIDATVAKRTALCNDLMQGRFYVGAGGRGARASRFTCFLRFKS